MNFISPQLFDLIQFILCGLPAELVARLVFMMNDKLQCILVDSLFQANAFAYDLDLAIGGNKRKSVN